MQIKAVEERYHYIQQLEHRKEEVIRLIQEQNKLTPELEQAIQAAIVLQRVEDTYRPYKQSVVQRRQLRRKRTRTSCGSFIRISL